jgi:protein SMG5
MHSGWMKSLKVLFDWLYTDSEIIIGCFRSNPEFVDKIMRLMNLINIDIFTRKIYFDRSLLTFGDVREDLRHLFDIRFQIATTEDITFKKCAMFEELQQTIDWNLNYKLQITPDEDVILRTFKITDFGFHLSKIKTFNYSFCARSRMFIERQSRSRSDRRKTRRNSDSRNRRKGKDREDLGARRERRRNRRRRERGDRCSKPRFSEENQCEHSSTKNPSQESQEIEEYPSIEESHEYPRRGYLKNKASKKESMEKSEAEKNEMMGKLGRLWLKNEVKTLESRAKPVSLNMTPYLIVDTSALIDYLHVVKNLVKTKKFVVLIPKAGRLRFMNS